jgi:hypothetical protein
MGLGRLTSNSITHMDLHKLNYKLVSAWLEHFGAHTNHGQTQTKKTHHGLNLRETTTFPPYSILYTWPQDQHLNVILFWDSQVGVSKFSQLGFLRL